MLPLLGSSPNGLILDRLFNHSAYSDASIRLGDVLILVHRFMLCTQSKYYADALDRDCIEVSTKILTSPAQKEQIYSGMLQYLYMGTYEDDAAAFIQREGTWERLSFPKLLLTTR